MNRGLPGPSPCSGVRPDCGASVLRVGVGPHACKNHGASERRAKKIRGAESPRILSDRQVWRAAGPRVLRDPLSGQYCPVCYSNHSGTPDRDELALTAAVEKSAMGLSARQHASIAGASEVL